MMMPITQGTIAGAPTQQQDSVLVLIASLEKNFDHARELLALIIETADTLTGPRPQPVEDRKVQDPSTMVGRLRQADLNINAALAAMRAEMQRLRSGLGMTT